MRGSSILLVLAAVLGGAGGFSPLLHKYTLQPSKTTLYARNKNDSRGKGFGKTEEPPQTQPKQPLEQSRPIESSKSTFSLQNVEKGGSTATPTVEDDGRAPEERARDILRNKYGLKTLEEQQMDAKQLAAYKEQQKKLRELKRKVENNEDIDIFAILPGPVIIGIDRFLKVGVAITGLTFILAGIGITIEAYSKATNSPLPDDIDNFIVQTIEPNFTPLLVVLLGFSVSLGAFAAAQLGSQGATYREE